MRAVSSVGRAVDLHSSGRRFESCTAHKKPEFRLVSVRYTVLMGNITFTDSITGINVENLQGFFIGWQKTPSPEVHLKILKESSYRILALDDQRVIGFITAVSDNTLAAYISFLEVLPEYQNQEIGRELMSRMLSVLKKYYMVDVLCDQKNQIFYELLGMKKAVGMMIHNYENQDGSGMNGA
jgi:ribosomal protein S18 acetylase RimI-like enzyme